MCFRAAFQKDRIHDACHKDLGLWEVKIILTINDKQDIEANPTYLIFKATKKIALSDSNILVLCVSVKMFFSILAMLCYKYRKFMRDFSISWCFPCRCVWKSLFYGLHQVFLPGWCSAETAGCWCSPPQEIQGTNVRVS